MPYDADSRPTNPHSTRTSADRPSTRSASLKADGTPPARNCEAVARQRTNVSDSPPTMTTSSTFRGARMAPRAAVRSGARSVQTSSVISPLQLGEAADVHRLEPIHDSPDEDAKHEDREDHVEEDSELHDQRHARGDPERNHKDRVLDRQQREDLADRFLARHHQEQPDHQRGQSYSQHVMRHAHCSLGKARAHAVTDDGQP